MTKRLCSFEVACVLGFLVACSGQAANPGIGGAPSTGGTPSNTAGTQNGGTPAAGGAPAASGAGGVAGSVSGGAPAGGAGAPSGGAAGSGGMSGGAGSASGGATAQGCGMLPQGNDSETAWVKHDVEVTGVDPTFIKMYPPDAGTQYSWTHRNYFMRLPTGYDSTKSYPVTIGSSGCGGPETVGSEGGYSPLGVAAGETEAIQVALSYVISKAADPDCNGALFADDFTNSPEQPYLAAVVKDLEAKYCVDPKKVFLGGYSSRAFETITLGCANADILRGTGVQIGGGLRQHHPACTGKVAAMFVVGNQDMDNPIGPLAAPLHDSLGSAPARDEVLQRNGCVGTTTAPWDANYPACVTYTGCPKEYPVVWCPIDSGHLPDKSDPAVGKYRYEGLWKFWSSLP